jgi:hypothetical protein
VVPDGFFANRQGATHLLSHELFHILSSHNPELRDRLYRIIHFEPTSEIELPEALQSQRLTNPDAPSNRHVVYLDKDGQKIPVVPVLISKSKEFQPGGLFANLDFKLMVLEKHQDEKQQDKFVPKLVDGNPQFFSPSEATDYLQKIGRNTGYIIHPEEVLADNFSMLILGRAVRDKWVIDAMRAALKK